MTQRHHLASLAQQLTPPCLVPPQADGPSRAAKSAMEAEREQLALALERLAEVQRELAEGQRALMASQRQLQEQQGRMLGAMAAAPPSPSAQ